MTKNTPGNSSSVKKSEGKILTSEAQFYIILALPILYLVVFHYAPMLGAILAFKQYNIRLGVLGSPFVGFRYFKQFFNSPQAVRLIQNTLGLSLFQLILGFPVPIILALALNEVGSKPFKKLVQTITFAPYFISVVVLVALVLQFMAPRTGFMAIALQKIGFGDKNFLGDPNSFRPLYVLSGIWQTSGYNAILYIAALSGVDPSLYEAAIVDGASRFKRILAVDLPCIAPTIIVLLILESGRIMSVGFEKAYLMQNDMNITRAEIISTYVYKIGLINNQVSFSTAVGLFNSVVNLVLILTVNKIARKVSEVGLW